MSEESNNRPSRPSWVAWPFAEQLFVLALFICLGPGAAAIVELRHRDWIGGIVILALWGFPFVALLRFLNDRKAVRFVISIPCTLLVLIASLFV